MERNNSKRLTRAIIIKSVCEKTGLKVEYIGLEKALESDGGTYYWSGKVAACMSAECNTHVQRLNDWSLERWVESLEGKIQESRPWDYPLEIYTGADLNKYIESIDWTLEE